MIFAWPVELSVITLLAYGLAVLRWLLLADEA
jgi:hypothetical protein